MILFPVQLAWPMNGVLLGGVASKSTHVYVQVVVAMQTELGCVMSYHHYS